MDCLVTAIIQARVGSTRFPNKVFAELNGKPIIWHIINRLKCSKQIKGILVATTNSPGDDLLQGWCTVNNVACFRGSENDVLARYYYAALCIGAKNILRVTADDPFRDPEVIDMVINEFIQGNYDFCYNNHPPSFPEGLDTEVFTFEALSSAHNNSKDLFEREHVTQFFYRNPSMFRQINLSYKEDISFLRLTIDTREDYELAVIIYKHLGKNGEIFLLQDIVNFIKANPELVQINNMVKKSAMYLSKDKPHNV